MPESMSQTDLLYLENEWKELTKAGNDLCPKTTEQALIKYRSALAKAEKLMQYLNKCIASKIPVMPIFLISCNNLAETYCKLEKWDKADKMLKRGIFYIEFLRKKELHPDAEKVFHKWLFKQLLLYKEFTVRSDQHEKYKALIERLRQDESDSQYL
jgi:hypothetical protein